VDQRADLRQRHDDRVLGELAAGVLRPARPDDAEAIAALHLAVWRATYCDLAPPAAYRTLGDLALRIVRWRETLADAGGARATLVVEAEGRLLGIGHCGPPSEAIFGARGEVKSLYVDRSVSRRGIGRRLLAGLVEALRDRAYAGMALGVVVGNAQAIAFYDALGGCALGRYTDPGPVWRSDNIAYGWDDLPGLLQRSNPNTPTASSSTSATLR